VAILLLKFHRLLGHALPLQHVRLKDDLPFQCRPAVNDGYDQENGNGDQMRESFFQYRRIHILFIIVPGKLMSFLWYFAPKTQF